MNERRSNLTELKFSLLDSRGPQAAHWRIVVVHRGVCQKREVILQRSWNSAWRSSAGTHSPVVEISRNVSRC